MQCESCGGDDAVIRYTHIEKNEKRTLHLCQACAAARGVEPDGEPAPAPLSDFLAQMGKSLSEPSPAGGVCPSCGLTLAEFKRSGRLGCTTCYTHFAPQLRALLRRLHGGTQHMGKAFVAPGPTSERPLTRLLNLRRSLQRAVEREEFERAAALRDQIRRLEEESAPIGEDA